MLDTNVKEFAGSIGIEQAAVARKYLKMRALLRMIP